MDIYVTELLEELRKGSRKASFAIHEYVSERVDENHSMLVPALADGLLDLETRDGCAFALECIGPAAKAAIPNLITQLQYKPDDWVVSPFARALGAMGHEAESAVPALVEMLQVFEDGLDTPVILEALVSIGINSPDVVTAIERLAKDGFCDEVRSAGRSALTKLRG